MSTSFIGPMLAMVGLTLVVLSVALRNRMREIRARRIPLQSLAKARDVATAFENCQATDNFNNLMQMPVLFYVLCLLLQQQGITELSFVVGAWVYVALRMTHSVIQSTFNRVIQRFYVWVASNAVLFGLWIGTGLHWLMA